MFSVFQTVLKFIILTFHIKFRRILKKLILAASQGPRTYMVMSNCHPQILVAHSEWGQDKMPRELV
jgi:hypothetical protein